MVYALAISAAIAFALGYGLAEKVSAEKIAVLEHSIIEANLSMDAVLQAHIAQKKQNDLEAEAKNAELEKSYEQNVATVNDYFDRVRASDKARRHNAVPRSESACTPEVQTETPTSTDPTEFTEFKRNAYMVDAWAESCLQFVNDKCRIRNGLGPGMQ